MANEKALTWPPGILAKRIEGETVDGAPAFALAVTSDNSPAAPDQLSVCLIASGGYSTSQVTDLQETPGACGMYIFWDIYSAPSSGTALLTISARYPCDGDYGGVWQSSYMYATGSPTGMKKYLMYPGAVDTASMLTSVCQLPVPQEWRAQVTLVSSTNWGFSLGIQYVDI
jgi:hypothetical protein